MDRQTQIRAAIEDAGAHAVLTLTSLEEDAYGMSPFEVFVLNGEAVKHRMPIHHCTAATVDNGDGTRRFELFVDTQGFGNSVLHSSKVVGEHEDTEKNVLRFGAMINSSPLVDSWSYLWDDVILKAFEHILIYKNVCQKINPRMVEFYPPIATKVLTAVGFTKSLFTALDSFLISPGHESDIQKKLRGGLWEEGITPSLQRTVEYIDNFSSSYGVYFREYGIFSCQQMESLDKIGKELEEYKKYDKFWKELTKDPNFDDKVVSNNLDLLRKLIDNQISSPCKRAQLISTYIHTNRNCLAHNRRPLRLHQQYAWYIESKLDLVEEAITAASGFLSRIHSEVCGMPQSSFDSWLKSANSEAEKLAKQIADLFQRQLVGLS